MKSENRMTVYIVLTAAIITVFSFLEAARRNQAAWVDKWKHVYLRAINLKKAQAGGWSPATSAASNWR